MVGADRRLRAAVLGTGLLVLVGYARAFSALFWRTDGATDADAAAAAASAGAEPLRGAAWRGAALALLVATLVATAAASGPLYAWCERAAVDLADVARYRAAAGLGERTP